VKQFAIVIACLALIGLVLGVKYSIPGQEQSPLWPILIGLLILVGILLFAKSRAKP
jgi:LPXTG-motif cell wall-anchored protein